MSKENFGYSRSCHRMNRSIKETFKQRFWIYGILFPGVSTVAWLPLLLFSEESRSKSYSQESLEPSIHHWTGASFPHQHQALHTHLQCNHTHFCINHRCATHSYSSVSSQRFPTRVKTLSLNSLSCCNSYHIPLSHHHNHNHHQDFHFFSFFYTLILIHVCSA